MSAPRIEIHPETGQKIYEPDGDILYDYICDRAHVSGIRGPIGSGTSTASCHKIWQIACEQKPFNGVRKTRWAIVRNTYPELVGTTLQTWLTWFPEEVYGRLNRSRPMCQTLRVADVECEVWFLALDNDSDIQKLRSREMTGFWLNEIEYIPKAIFDEAESRTGRYPSVAEGGATWDGILFDMNAPSEDFWLVQMTGEVPYPEEVPLESQPKWPSDWSYFVQPPALIELFGTDNKTVVGYKPNPEAENVKWLKPGFYEEKMRGKAKQWIDSRLQNRITFVASGDPVWPNASVETHIAKRDIDPTPGYEIIVSEDFGRSRPAALCAQVINNRILCISEFRLYNAGAGIFQPQLKRFLEQHYPGFTIRFTGDPKGADKGMADERSSYDIAKAHGMIIQPAPVKNNHLQTRLEAVTSVLGEMENGQPRLLVSPRCTTLRAALGGRYQMTKAPTGEPEPLKDKYSDIADCLQYLCLFLGEGRKMIGLEVRGAGTGRIKVSEGRRSLRRVK